MKINQHQKTTIILTGLILLILLLSVAALLWQWNHSTKGTTALIYQEGVIVQTIDLSNPASQGEYKITCDQGTNTITVKDGKIGVTDTDCPDKICQQMGMIHSSSYPISCLPHRLVIQLTTRGMGTQSPEPDAVTN